MAKRRNLKKEKALRNQAYARKFRKRNSGNKFAKRRFGGSPFGEGVEVEEQEIAEDSDSAAI
jgi:hypothetical protein